MNYEHKYNKYKAKYVELKRISNNKTYQEVLYDIAKYIKPHIHHNFRKKSGIKQLSNQVNELNKVNYFTELHSVITNYYITDKIDGKRTILYLTNDKSYAVNDVLKEIDIKTADVTILDTELYDNNYYVFDVMLYEGKSLINSPFEERMKYFDKLPQIKTKKFIKLTANYKNQIRDFKKETKEYEVDGIILTPADGLYNTMKVYKYKPPNQLTIDFLIKKYQYDTNGLTNNRDTHYALFCGINKQVFYKLSMNLIKYYDKLFPNINTKNLPHYFPIQFEPSSAKNVYLFVSNVNNLDGKVGEFLYDIKNKEWILKKIRDDRKIEVERGNYFGNNYKIAETIWMSCIDPLIIENIEETDIIYFQEHDNILQKASRNFADHVKSEIFKKFRNTKWVIDVASGKGQDLFKYSSNNMRNVIFLEKHNVALAELISRKHSFTTDDKYRNHMNIMIQNVDLLHDYKDNIDKINNIYTGKSIDLIMCMFAFHYLMKNVKSLQNVCKLIDHYLKKYGKFVFTAFDGQKIVNLLEKNNGEWTIKVGNDIKYSIKKKYDGYALNGVGQKIDVILPFSKNTYYEEYLINIDAIEKELRKYNIILEQNKSFSEYIGTFDGYLDENDKKYVNLYHYYIFIKK